MKGEDKNKPHISIPQKSAVAIVPPKKVRHSGYRSMPDGFDNILTLSPE
jgi:hypothetical protein